MPFLGLIQKIEMRFSSFAVIQEIKCILLLCRCHILHYVFSIDDRNYFL